MFLCSFCYIWPFVPLPNFFGRTNHTNLTRRIDPRHPEPPNSSIPPKRSFSCFHFLGLGPEEVRFLSFRGVVGSVFRASGEGWGPFSELEGGGPFSGLQGRGGGPFSGFQGREGGPSSHVWGLAGSWGNALAACGGMHRGRLHYPLVKEIQ